MTKERRPKKKTRTAKGQLRDGHHLRDLRVKGGQELKTNEPERQGRSPKQEARQKGLGLLRKKTYEGGGPNIATSNSHRIRRLKEEMQTKED